MPLANGYGQMGATHVQLGDMRGSGACGFVFETNLISDDDISHPLAIKFDTDDKSDYINREAAVPHEHIRNTLEVLGPYHFKDQTGTHPAILMKDLQGARPISELTTTGAPMSLKDTVTVMTHVAQTLADAEKLKLVHSDIKPSNIMFNKASNETTVIDWAGHEETGKEATIITGMYADNKCMEPEPKLHPKQDVFALALSSAEMLNGRTARPLPMEAAKSNYDLNAFHANDKRLPWVKRDDHLKAIIHEAAHPDRAQRSTALDMMTNLSAFPEARALMTKKDINEIATNITNRASDPDFQDRRPLLAAAAKGIQDVVPLSHPHMGHVLLISKLDNTYAPKLGHDPLAQKPQDINIHQEIRIQEVLDEFHHDKTAPMVQLPPHSPRRK